MIYAFGLGKTLPAAPDGVAATGPSPVVVPVYLDLNFAPNAPPITVPAATTTYQPNYAGLYARLCGPLPDQLNVAVHDPIRGFGLLPGNQAPPPIFALSPLIYFIGG